MSILPGLWDMHVHLMITGHSDYTYWDKTYLPIYIFWDMKKMSMDQACEHFMFFAYLPWWSDRLYFSWWSNRQLFSWVVPYASPASAYFPVQWTLHIFSIMKAVTFLALFAREVIRRALVLPRLTHHAVPVRRLVWTHRARNLRIPDEQEGAI